MREVLNCRRCSSVMTVQDLTLDEDVDFVYSCKSCSLTEACYADGDHFVLLRLPRSLLTQELACYKHQQGFHLISLTWILNDETLRYLEDKEGWDFELQLPFLPYDTSLDKLQDKINL